MKYFKIVFNTFILNFSFLYAVVIDDFTDPLPWYDLTNGQQSSTHVHNIILDNSNASVNVTRKLRESATYSVGVDSHIQ